MPLILCDGSLLDAPEEIIAHGCNAQGVAGSGVAKALKDRWPQAIHAYEFAVGTGRTRVGDVIWGDIPGGRLLANIITQQNYGRVAGYRYVSYDAIDKGLREVAKRALERGATVVAIPRIGAGTGGGHWPVIERMIEHVSELGVTFKVYDNKLHAQQADLFKNLDPT